MALNPFENLGPGLHWVHANGPDGPCVLLIQWMIWGERACIIDDGDRVDQPHQDEEGTWWLHKWKVSCVEEVVRPDHKAVNVPISNPTKG